MRTIKDRNNREVYMHKPIGVSATQPGAALSIEEVLKKTSILERENMVSNSPLYDEFEAGTPIESLDLLEYMDLGIQPLDFTDADHLRQIAKAQVEELKAKYEENRAAASVRTQGEPKASTPAEGGATIL